MFANTHSRSFVDFTDRNLTANGLFSVPVLHFQAVRNIIIELTSRLPTEAF
jgi:hypothetical protein